MKWLDGWAARDLDVGAIIALAPKLTRYKLPGGLQLFADLLSLVDPSIDEDTVRDVRNDPDLVTRKLARLHLYQLSLPAPKPPRGSYDADAAERGDALFEGKADCARCHVPPLYTEPGWNMHTPEEIGIDDFQAKRSPDEHYRTSPLKGLWTHTEGGFYHDGRFGTLDEVVEHYDEFFGLGLSGGEKADLVEYLKSL